MHFHCSSFGLVANNKYVGSDCRRQLEDSSDHCQRVTNVKRWDYLKQVPRKDASTSAVQHLLSLPKHIQAPQRLQLNAAEKEEVCSIVPIFLRLEMVMLFMVLYVVQMLGIKLTSQTNMK